MSSKLVTDFGKPVFLKQTPTNSNLIPPVCFLPQADWRYSKWAPRAQLSVPWDSLVGCTAGQPRYPAAPALSNERDNPVRIPAARSISGPLITSASGRDTAAPVFFSVTLCSGWPCYSRKESWSPWLLLGLPRAFSADILGHYAFPKLHTPTRTPQPGVWLLWLSRASSSEPVISINVCYQVMELLVFESGTVKIWDILWIQSLSNSIIFFLFPLKGKRKLSTKWKRHDEKRQKGHNNF